MNSDEYQYWHQGDESRDEYEPDPDAQHDSRIDREEEE